MCAAANLPSGTIYPILARLEREYGWLESEWEDPDISVTDGRPRRRYYRLSNDGAQAARLALAESYQARQSRRRTFGGKPGSAGATS
ncbi:PadR family transcriptional regulator [Catenulispora subtropica]